MHKTVFSKADSSSVFFVYHHSLSQSHYAVLFAYRCTIGLNVALMVLFLSLSITFFLLAAGQQNMRCLKVNTASVLFHLVLHQNVAMNPTFIPSLQLCSEQFVVCSF